MILAVHGYDAFELLACAAPVAGFAAFAHVHATRRRRQLRRAEAASRSCRSVFVEVPGAAGAPAGSVRFELTPQLLGWLAAARSGALKGLDTPDAVMLAFDIEAHWKSVRAADPALGARSQLVATRERFFVRAVEAGRDSAAVALRPMLDAHRQLAEGEPLHCAAEGGFGGRPPRRLRVAAAAAGKPFYWVRAPSAPPRAGRPPS
jgi:hypothetical protein